MWCCLANQTVLTRLAIIFLPIYQQFFCVNLQQSTHSLHTQFQIQAFCRSQGIIRSKLNAPEPLLCWANTPVFIVLRTFGFIGFRADDSQSLPDSYSSATKSLSSLPRRRRPAPSEPSDDSSCKSTSSSLITKSSSATTPHHSTTVTWAVLVIMFKKDDL